MKANVGTIGRWALVAVVLESALALGAVRTSALVVLILLAGVAAVATVSRERLPLRSSAKTLLWVGGGLTVFTALQAVPIPAALLGAIAPHNADVWARALRPFGEPGPHAVPISVDPVATRIQFARGVAYLLTFLAAVEVARTRSGARFLMWTLVASGTAVTIAALLHPALDQTKVFGLYAPHSEIAPRHVAPLLDANHLAAYLNVTLCCALVLALDEDLGRARILPGAIAALVAAAQFWVASRGGVVAMFVGVGAIGALRILRVRSAAVAPLMFALVVLGGIAMAVFGQWDSAWMELADSDVSKLHLFVQDLPMLHAYPIFGAGRGAFESAFPEFRMGLGYEMMTNPENVLLQWGIEWGIPVASAGIIAVVVALRPSVAMARGKWTAGAWAALAAVGLHNLVDFSSETPGVVIALCVCAALVVGGTRASRARGRERRASPPRWAWLAGLATVAAVVALAALGRDVESDRAALLADRAATSSRFEPELRAAMLRHPAEPYLPYVGALHARLVGRSVVPWVGRTLERAPVYGPAHLLLARELVRRSPAQARLEDRVGIEQIQSSPTTNGVIEEAIRVGLVRSYADAIELVPVGPERATALDLLSARMSARRPATSYRLDRLRLQVPPTALAVLRRRGQDGIADLKGGRSAPWCDADRAACLRSTLDDVQRLELADPQSCEARALEAEARIQGSDAQNAFLKMRAFTRTIAEKGGCLAELARVALEAGLPEEASITIDELSHATCTTSEECVSNLLAAASLEQSMRNPRRALALYQKASDLKPDRDDISAVVGDLALSLQRYADARAAYERLLRRHPGDAKYQVGLKKANDGVLRERVEDVNSAPP